MFLFRSVFISATVALIFIANLAAYVAAAPQWLPYHFVMDAIPSSDVASAAAVPTEPAAVPDIINIDPSPASAASTSEPSAAVETPPAQTNGALSVLTSPGILFSTVVAGIYLVF
ncbi:hypothetical protein CERSUDRAFT_119329 [Gelatoporia subvermispora B]|uniref:Transmembrane protein n=1 Tax=Ceriporiopsis subvermispora (strain B) TaxID=914234 RepID=M2QYZ1_CERS8|nr:hypothetical protein CERSUDRAFT_119329 [Gelatoporia subvermispora B]